MIFYTFWPGIPQRWSGVALILLCLCTFVVAGFAPSMRFLEHLPPVARDAGAAEALPENNALFFEVSVHATLIN